MLWKIRYVQLLIVYTARKKTSYKSVTGNEYILGIRKEIRARILNLVIVSKSQGEQVEQLTERICSDSVDMATLGQRHVLNDQ